MFEVNLGGKGGLKLRAGGSGAGCVGNGRKEDGKTCWCINGVCYGAGRSFLGCALAAYRVLSLLW